jgi:hypothetical protein
MQPLSAATRPLGDFGLPYVTVVEPGMPRQMGCVHPKLMLLRYTYQGLPSSTSASSASVASHHHPQQQQQQHQQATDMLRVAVTSANLNPQDWLQLGQNIWIQVGRYY